MHTLYNRVNNKNLNKYLSFGFPSKAINFMLSKGLTAFYLFNFLLKYIFKQIYSKKKRKRSALLKRMC